MGDNHNNYFHFIIYVLNLLKKYLSRDSQKSPLKINTNNIYQFFFKTFDINRGKILLWFGSTMNTLCIQRAGLKRCNKTMKRSNKTMKRRNKSMKRSNKTMGLVENPKQAFIFIIFPVVVKS